MELKHIFPGITDEQLHQLNQFCTLVKEWNQRVNLISRQDTANLREHHIFPSIIPLNFIDIPPDSWIFDIGSGGGFPAIPLKILRPDLQMVLADSVRKKTLFLKKVIANLKLEKIAVSNQRVEELGSNPDFQNKFDIITARAVGQITTLVKWGKPFLKKEGFYLLWKGASDIPELENNAGIMNYSYRVFSVPGDIQHLSPKFKDLRWFVIRF